MKNKPKIQIRKYDSIGNVPSLENLSELTEITFYESESNMKSQKEKELLDFIKNIITESFKTPLQGCSFNILSEMNKYIVVLNPDDINRSVTTEFIFKPNSPPRTSNVIVSDNGDQWFLAISCGFTDDNDKLVCYSRHDKEDDRQSWQYWKTIYRYTENYDNLPNLDKE